jgi:Flp pilus assembly protein TadD
LQGRWRDAGLAFGECVRMDRNDRDAKWRQVVCRFRAGDFESARRDYEALRVGHDNDADMIRSWAAAQIGAGAPESQP